MSYHIVVKMINIKAGVPQNVFRTRMEYLFTYKTKTKKKENVKQCDKVFTK